MKYSYSIAIQFAKPSDTPDFYSIENLIQDALGYYNRKSLMAANPKEVIGYTIIDAHTLNLILKSENKLTEAYASKALRLFTIYLLNHGLSDYLYNQRLFKTSCELLNESPSPSPEEESSKKEVLSIEEKLDLILSKLENIENYLKIGGDY